MLRRGRQMLRKRPRGRRNQGANKINESIAGELVQLSEVLRGERGLLLGISLSPYLPDGSFAALSNYAFPSLYASDHIADLHTELFPTAHSVLVSYPPTGPHIEGGIRILRNEYNR